MDRDQLNARIEAQGGSFYRLMGEEKPSLFDRSHWTGKIMDWCLRDPHFKVQLLRFVDVFPSLTSADAFDRHLKEYFGDEELELPSLVKLGARSSGMLGRLGSLVVEGAVRQQIRTMGHQFIIGETEREAVANLGKLRKQGFAFVVDLLGEATVSKEEAQAMLQAYLNLVEALRQERPDWQALGTDDPQAERDWGHAPLINLSVKPTSFYPQARAVDFAGSVAAIRARIEPLYRDVIAADGFLCIDMEATGVKDITLELYRQLRSAFPEENRLGVVLQAYLTDSDRDLENLLQWARKQALPISIRLVKGAYWDQETIKAGLKGWRVPVYQRKAESDAAFERMAETILRNHDICHLACASHNIRSIAAVLEMARALEVPEEHYEFQLLYGMAEPVRNALLKLCGRVRLYCPYGELLPGMAYFVRRLLENTANDSFLRQSFAEETDIADLMRDPRAVLAEAPDAPPPSTGGFVNEPQVDFTVPESRQAFVDALAAVRAEMPREQPLIIGGERIATGRLADSVNPARPSEVVGRIHQASTEEAESAVRAARDAFPDWRDTPASERAALLRRAAKEARQRIFELSAWQVLEVGKQWDQAYADLAEGIDFLEYYAGEMERLAPPVVCGGLPGEDNRHLYQPKGVAVVIAPWNFPFAISMGMISAALVTGNTVVYKPSGLSAVTGALVVEILQAAGLPPGVLNYLPGAGSEIGDPLVDHPAVNMIAFTGSREVGLRINQRAAVVYPGQHHLKKVVCEMGGKNAIIVDDDADLDEAIPHILASAFGYQGQKCSACSRLIVLDALYDRLAQRLVEAARCWRLGPAEDPACHMGPMVDAAAQKKVLAGIATACDEGTLLYRSEVPDGAGYYVPLTLVGDIRPEHRTAQEEIFGPMLALMRASDFDQALEWANGTAYALTGGVFSRSPRHLERSRREFRVGNLYLNRNNTGALVGRQPFGGFKLSGGGTKAGGFDYLRQFMDPRVVTENTLRRGFAPEALR